MTIRESTIAKLQNLPEPMVLEVDRFIESLINKRSVDSEGRNSLEPQTTDIPDTYQPIWEYAEELMQDATPEDLALLPPDSAKNHDPYLNTNFWESEPLSSQSTPVITDISVLAASFWEDEPIDEFDKFIASSRQADR